MCEWVHLYVDASFDPSGYSGAGGALFDSAGTCIGSFSEPISLELLDDIMREDQERIILELEGLAILAGLTVFAQLIRGKRVVVFTDNQAVQSCFVKCRSANENLDLIIKGTCSLEETLDVVAWIERVPSFSNPADILSRQVVKSFMGVDCSPIDLPSLWAKCKQGDGKTSLILGAGARGKL